MQQTTFTESLMRGIAQELGKPYSAFEDFTKTLLENWVDSKEALLMLDEASIAQLKFPLLLQKKLIDKIQQFRIEGPRPTPVDSKLYFRKFHPLILALKRQITQLISMITKAI